MPRLFEINTDNDVLCYIPSGKLTSSGQQKTQLRQDGDTCWFYSTKRLANSTGFQYEDSRAQERYRLVSNFRKTQSKLDSAVLIAATLLAKNISTDIAYGTAIAVILSQNSLTKAYKFSPFLVQKIIGCISTEEQMLPRQLKDLKRDATTVLEFVERYKKYNPGQITNSNPQTIETIVQWLKARNPYQSHLLESACNCADALSKLDSTEFSGVDKDWAVEPRQLIVTQPSTSSSSALNPAVIILGGAPTPSTSSTTTSKKELTVAEKQDRRKLSLADFNQKINRETLNIFRMQTTTFKTAEELKVRLKEYGPVMIRGYYGQKFYTAPTHVLKDPDGNTQTFGTRQLVGWKQSEAKGEGSFSLGVEHQVTIIGIKYNTENPNRSQVIFIDPNDTSFPGEQRKAYAISFERLSNNRSLKYRHCGSAYYSTAERSPESTYERETKGATISPVKRLFSYGAIAAVGVGAAYATYNTMNPKI